MSAGTRAAASAQARRDLVRSVREDMRGADLTDEERREILLDLRAGDVETARWRFDTYTSLGPQGCPVQLHPASRTDPVELCGQPLEPHWDTCARHGEVDL